PAFAEVVDLLSIEQGVAEVDEVEVDPVDLRPAQVAAAEVCLADFLGRLEVLIDEFVGVEAGAGALARKRARQKSLPGGTHVEAGSLQVGFTKVCPLPVDFAQPSNCQVGTPQVGSLQSRAGQMRTHKVCLGQSGGGPIDFLQIGVRKACAPKACSLHDGGPQIGINQGRPGQFGIGEVRLVEPGDVQVRLREVRHLQ